MAEQKGDRRRHRRACVVHCGAGGAFETGPSPSGVVLQVVTPDVTVAATDNSAAEPGANTGTFTISRTGATTDPLTVNYSVTGTASNGSDYTAFWAARR